MRLTLLISAFLILSTQAMAAITVTGITGASDFELISSGNTQTTVYGGTSGEINGVDGVNVYNSCTDSAMTTSTADCNENRIYDNLLLAITFNSSDKTGRIVAVKSDNTTPITLNSSTSGSEISAGSTVTAYITWGALCDALDSDSNSCEGRDTDNAQPISVNFKLGIATGTNTVPDDAIDIFVRVWEPKKNINVDTCTTTDLTGICNLAMFPGDGKALVDDAVAIESATTFPIISGVIEFTKLRIFFKPGNSVTEFAQLFSGAADESHADFNLLDEGKTLSGGIVDNLTNGTPYVFRFASVDRAGNISNHQSSLHFTTNAANFSVTPSEVFGLLAEDVNCFVTTASYNSFMHPKVQTFRDFRNKFLLVNSWGQAFVDSYYKYGPFGSRTLNNNPSLKPVARVILWPAWLFAKLSLNIGLVLTSLIYLLSLGLLFLGIKTSYKRITA